jgi:chromosome segregation ATPase
MQTRYKILILLVTFAIGVLALWHFVGDNEAMVRFRSRFYGSAFYDLKPTFISAFDYASLWYGGIALLGVVMIALTFRAGRRDGPGTRERLIELKPTKVRTEKLLQGSSWYDRFKGHLQDVGFERKVRGLENELREKDELLQRQDEELDWLRSKVMIRPNLSGRENELQRELDGVTERLQVNASATAELESRLTAAQELLQNRSQEVDVLKEEAIRLTQQLDDLRLGKEQTKDSITTEVDALNSEVTHLREQLANLRLAKEEAEHVWQQELQAAKVSQASVMTAQENSLNEKVQVLESEVAKKQELLQNRDKELKQLKATKAKVNSLRERLAAAAAAKKQVENVLKQQLRKKTELLESKEVAWKEGQESAAAKVEALENDLREREQLLKDRAAAVEALESEVNRWKDASSDRERAKSLLVQELQNRTELLQAKEAKVAELQARLHVTLQALENAQSDVERLTRKGDLGVAVKDQLSKSAPPKSRPYRKGKKSTLFELGVAKARATASRQAEEARRTPEADSIRKQARQVSRRDQEQRGRKRT